VHIIIIHKYEKWTKTPYRIIQIQVNAYKTYYTKPTPFHIYIYLLRLRHPRRSAFFLQIFKQSRACETKDVIMTSYFQPHNTIFYTFRRKQFGATSADT